MGLTDDTIAAIATPLGTGGVGIIKISGPKSTEISAQIFRSRNYPHHLKSHRLYWGEVFDPRKGHTVDEVLLSFMAKPRSYTGEDVIEINCHGGLLVMQEILELVIKAGARLAEPGEFTKRAFLNGRIDLVQAEAVVDLIESKSTLGLIQASAQLKGVLSQEINALKSSLLELLSALEAAIDFPEEELELAPTSQLMAETDRSLSLVEKLLNTYAEGKVYREGASTIIAGKPNVGKSSLFNLLLSEERAIVTSVPGTTRDFIEEIITIKGIPLKLVDTAGLRNPADSIEEEGVRKTNDKLCQADLILLVIDSSVELDSRDQRLLPALNGKRVVVACNKIDLPRKVSLNALQSWFPKSPIVFISALFNQGIEELKEAAFSSLITDAQPPTSSPLVFNFRHKLSLESTLASIRRAKEGLQKEIPLEFTASDLRDALHHLGEITGHTTPEEVLDQIFSRFCIGK